MNEVNTTSAISGGLRGASSALGQGKSAVADKVAGDALPAQDPKTIEAVEKPEVEVAQVDEAVAKLNDYVQSTQRDLYFAYDDAVNKTVVTVVDRNTEQVVRQIPNEVALTLAAKLNEEEPLRLFSAQA